MNVRKRLRLFSTPVAATGVLALLLTACGGGGGGGTAAGGDGECDGGPAKEINIAYQPGLGYAPLLVAKQQGSLEEALPETKITWRELNSGAAIRDGMISGEIQVGSGGIGPFLVGYDSGVDWKVITGLNNMSLHVMTTNPSVKSVADLEGKGSIAMPGPDSIQSVVLRKAAEEQLGDARALDDQIVALGHPEGVQALIGGQLAAHVTSPPFQAREAAQGARMIEESYNVFGEHTFNSAFTLTEFADCNPEFISALVTEVTEANQMLADQPAEAAQILAAELGTDAATIEDQITDEDVTFSVTPLGFGTFAEFMAEIGLIREVPETSDLFFETAATEGAS
jgi:NitT/TauT family transport system substrate-binding protein